MIKNKIIAFFMVVFLVTNIVFGTTTSQKVKSADIYYISTGNSDCILNI